jgi:Ca-activated chloride channel family protein
MFAFLVLLVISVWINFRRKKSALTFSNVDSVNAAPASWRTKTAFLPTLLRIIAIILLIIALARPRKGVGISSVSTEGVAMMIVVDKSGSMGQQMQFHGRETTRLDTVKEVLHDFIKGGSGLEGRPSDLIGLVTFARYADTVCPLIHGHDVLLDFLRETQVVKQKSEDGTAIGDAVALAAARLELAEKELEKRKQKLSETGWSKQQIENESFEIKSKVIVLLTDGVNNAGTRSPQEAAEYASQQKIKIYTIGIGGKARKGIFGMFARTTIDEQLLNSMAVETGGFYARADNGKQLMQIYAEIDKLEKSSIKSTQYTQYTEQFASWLLAGLSLLFIEVLLNTTIYRKVP